MLQFLAINQKNMKEFKKVSQSSSLGYMVQLDSLRALAVFGVLVEHYVPDDLPGSTLSYWKSTLSLGSSAVTLFLVLSGFLITGILHIQPGTLQAS